MVDINISYTDINNNVVNTTIQTSVFGFNTNYQIKYGTDLLLSVNNNYYFNSTNATTKTLTNNATNQVFNITIEKQSGHTLTFVNDGFTDITLTNNFGNNIIIKAQGTNGYSVPINTQTNFYSTNGAPFQITNSNPVINPNWVNSPRESVELFSLTANTTINITNTDRE